MPRMTPADLNEMITLAVATSDPGQLDTVEALAARLGDRYSPTNTLAIWAQLPTATQVRGFRQWQEHGRVVAKGQKGLGVFMPNTRRKKDTEETGTPEPAAGGDGTRRQAVGYHVGYVWDISQTVPADCQEPRGACTCPLPAPAASGHRPDRQVLAELLAAYTTDEDHEEVSA
ncbi:ArdC family protein [Streptomonospora litoralis]|uniref:N-terminal domain-containing protein n=1 Tax=Streptomonospora litoralis TaxID=2498135 RepID=A0A4P6Q7N9_9ACTN|nr:ArdC family protein [Streptomonospora litoralis]QBI56816.1 hypothetical protein EKD16_25380 [Streptomonospora litoralis]